MEARWRVEVTGVLAGGTELAGNAELGGGIQRVGAGDPGGGGRRGHRCARRRHGV